MTARFLSQKKNFSIRKKRIEERDKQKERERQRDWDSELNSRKKLFRIQGTWTMELVEKQADPQTMLRRKWVEPRD